MWIVAAVDVSSGTEITLATAGARAAPRRHPARRLVTPPTEHVRLLQTLPIAEATVARAKRVHVGFRAVWAIGLAAGPMVVRLAAPLPAIIAGAMLLATVIGATLAARPLE
jgi:hypothetical protein